MTTGIVFDIKEFSVYDGPGVRSTVFLKGCPLRCKWCHNPEGLSPKPEIFVSAGSCLNCGRCAVEGCEKAKGGTCTACGKCIYKCPGGLRRICGKSYTGDELEAVLMRQSVFFKDGGGVTFSGGEPTMQSDFLLEMLTRLRKNGIHCAVQTCGYTPSEVFKQIIENTDFFLYDIKLADDAMHKAYTGVSNKLILENLKLLIESGKPFLGRTPIIDGVNNSVENLAATAELVKNAKNMLRFELLPYNGAAGGKYPMVGKEFAYPEFKAPEKIDVSPFTERGIVCKVL
ncbi:MAG: glycyl-radical enzyme activating protein [Clostridia bacterium]|nr:glycyl-radical enzyme activating protein [Clostridia bacterium]